MQFYTLACHCGCPDPMMKQRSDGTRAIIVFASEALAGLEAAELAGKTGKHPLVKKFEVKEVK